MKTTNTTKTKWNETKAWFRSPFMPSGQEMDPVCSTGPGVHTGLGWEGQLKSTSSGLLTYT